MADDDGLSLEDQLVSRQKQERKELQAKIQALKKSITKGDKKKKKEVQEEIALLEANLDRKHDEETAALSQTNLKVEDAVSSEANGIGSTDTEVNEIDASVNIKQPHVSKAQRRRDKKAAASKEREENIKEQEKLNQQGPRHKESAAITALLKERGLMLFSIPADGNCLYKAVQHQLEQNNETDENLSLTKVRKLTADHLRENSDNFLPFLSHPDTGDMLTAEQFEEYCRKVERTTAWGGQIELQALSNVLKRPIEVIQASSPPIILGAEHGPEKQPLILTYHRHMYRLGEHYNSVQPLSNDDNSNEFASDEQ